ncbi:hypothetical protein ACSEPM_24405 [Pseudomonas aeruginosa]|nr:hypothetical protein [Pseudomonas aeruginosa]HCF1908570.1 hypothetical protein [Pseudomonas aeruginosa]HCF1914064.1 hypothetical protein [Pseudomonas aeruginosa]HCF1914609.1 hypothetical protein [Pseudomonas aeruginosa]
MSQEFNENESEGDDLVVLADKLPTSMKTVQSIYNEITGKTEKKSRFLNDNHIVEFRDIEQLNIKINQLQEQFHIIASNCNVTIYHINDCKEQFSSFERFKLYDQSSISPCENIRLEYNILIKLPSTKKPQPYKITIDLHSRAALQKKAVLETGLSRRMIELVSMRTGLVEIEYIDYTVSRTFMTAINEWYDGLKKTKATRAIPIIQSHSHNIPSLLKLLSLVGLFAAFIYYKEALIPPHATLQNLFSATVSCIIGVSIIGVMSTRLGSACERAIDMYSPLSTLKLNRGDEEIVEGYNSSNQKSILSASLFAIITITLNLLSTYISIKIGIDS